MVFPFISVYFLSLCLLIMALGSILIYQRTSHEVTRVLSCGCAIVFLVCGFAIAHWSINLLCLLLLLNTKVSRNLLQTVRINK